MNKDLFESCRQVGEGKVPNDKDSEETKVKKLTEEGMIEPDPNIQSWSVMQDGKELDIVNFAVHMTADEVKQSLVDHDGFDPDITVVKESKVNEADDMEKTEDVPELKPATAAPKSEEEKEGDESNKEYLGKTEDTHFYIVTSDNPEDLQIVDQERVMKYSAKDNNLDVANIPTFIIQAIQDVEIEEIERSVFMKYLLPLLTEEEVPEEEETEEEEIPEEEPLEKEKSKAAESKADEKKEVPVCKKCGKRHWPFQKCEGVQSEKTSEGKVNEDIIDDISNKIILACKNYHPGEKKISFEIVSDIINNFLSTDQLAEEVFNKLKSKGYYVSEGKVSNDKDSEDSKIKKLIEMKVSDEENTFDVDFVDDGTVDTVIRINNREFRLMPEFTDLWKNEEGHLSEEGLEELALDVLANLEEQEYKDLVSGSVEKELPEEEVSEEEVEEGKVPNDKDSEETKVKKLTEEDINKESKVKKENVIRNRRSRRKVNEMDENDLDWYLTRISEDVGDLAGQPERWESSVRRDLDQALTKFSKEEIAKGIGDMISASSGWSFDEVDKLSEMLGVNIQVSKEARIPNEEVEEGKIDKSKVKKENVMRKLRSRRKVNESKIKEGFIVLFHRDFDSSKLSDDEVDEYYMEAMSKVDTIEDAKKELEVELEEVKDEDKKSIIQSRIAADEEDLEILRDNIKFLKVEAKNRGIELKESKIKVKSEEISLDEQKQMIRLNDLLNL